MSDADPCFEIDDDVLRKKYEIFGCVTSLILDRQDYCDAKILNLKLWIQPAIELSQVKIFFNGLRQPVGYVTWAYLSDEGAVTLVRDRNCLHLSAWNEGRHLWIIDMHVPNGWLPHVYAFFQSEAFREHSSIFWARQSRRSGVKVRRKTIIRHQDSRRC